MSTRDPYDRRYRPMTEVDRLLAGILTPLDERRVDCDSDTGCTAVEHHFDCPSVRDPQAGHRRARATVAR